MIKWNCPTCKATFEDKTIDNLRDELVIIRDKINIILNNMENADNSKKKYKKLAMEKLEQW